MKETIYIRKNAPVLQAYSASLHTVYRNSKATIEYDDDVFVHPIEEHDNEVRKETAREILHAMNTYMTFYGNEKMSTMLIVIKDLAKEYGVDLEEKYNERL